MITVEHIKKCYADLQKEGVWDDDESQFRKNFLKWSLKNHPDKNPGNENIVQLYQAITGCRNDFLENFNQYKNISKGLYDVQQPKPAFGDKFNEFFKKYAQPTQKPKPTPKAKKAKSAPKKKSKAKKAKSAPKKKSKAKKAKSAPKKSKAKKAKSAPKKKSKAKKAKSAPKKSKRSSPKKNSKAKKSKKSKRSSPKKKSKAKKSKSAPKKKSKAKKSKSAPKKSKSKKAKSAPKKSKSKKAKFAPKKSKSKKAKSAPKKSKAKKQKGGKPTSNPGEFLRKKQQRVNKPSPLRNEIKPDEEAKTPQIKRIKLVQKKSNLAQPYDAPEWRF